MPSGLASISAQSAILRASGSENSPIRPADRAAHRRSRAASSTSLERPRIRITQRLSDRILVGLDLGADPAALGHSAACRRPRAAAARAHPALRGRGGGEISMPSGLQQADGPTKALLAGARLADILSVASHTVRLTPGEFTASCTHDPIPIPRRFHGAGHAISRGAVDEAAFVRLVERQIAGGVHGLVPVGTTGETATLSHDEHRRVVELCVETAAGRVPVIAGAGSNSTAEAIELTRHAKAVGADAVLVVTALLQPAEPGGPLPPLRGDRRGGRHADRGLQRARRAPASTSPTRRWRGWRSCRTSSASRTPPATCRAPACSG